MNRDFLKEAIADAKTVKESAIANAKAALEEAFSPQIQAMFASRLEEMEKEEMEEGEDMEEGYEKDMDEAQGEGFDSTRGNYDLDGIPGNMLEADEDIDEDVDLDEILAELEKDEVKEESEEVSEGKEEIDEAEEVEEAEVTEAEEDEAEEDEAEDAEEDEDEEIDLEDMSEEDLKNFIEDVIADMVEAGELEGNIESEDSEEGEIDIDMNIDAEETEIAEVEVEEEIEEGKSELDEALETIATLRDELNEINLLNAKLLYSNKIFKAKNMTESQKAKVLGAFDKATTINEVKVVFEALNENFKPATKPVNEGIVGSASKATGAIQTSKQPIVESNEMVNRFKKLAGII